MPSRGDLYNKATKFMDLEDGSETGESSERSEKIFTSK